MYSIVESDCKGRNFFGQEKSTKLSSESILIPMLIEILVEKLPGNRVHVSLGACLQDEGFRYLRRYIGM